MRGFVGSLGRVSGGFSLGGVRVVIVGFWFCRICWIMFGISWPVEGPVAASKWTSLVRRSRLILGRHPVRMIFLFLGVCFMSFMMRFSVGPLTAQVL